MKKDKDETLKFRTDDFCWSETEYTRYGGDFLEELTSNYRKFGRDIAVALGRDSKGRRVERIYRVDSDGELGALKEDRVITRRGYEIIKYDDERKPTERIVFELSSYGDKFPKDCKRTYVEHLEGSLDRPTYSVDYRPTKDGKGETERWYDKKGKVKEKVETHRRETGKNKEIVTINRYKGENEFDDWQETEQTLIENFYGGDRRETTKLFRGYTSDYDKKLVQETRMNFNSKKGRQNILVIDGKGRIVQRKVIIDFQGKYAEMDRDRGFFSKLKGRLFGKNGDRGGHVIASGLEGLESRDSGRYARGIDIARDDTNKELQKILKDGSLSGYQKKKKLRETIAQFREKKEVEAPNKKVRAALKKYLPPKKEGER